MDPAPAGDVDYAQASGGYSRHRRADPRIAAVIHAALGGARTVLNVGAGAGSYEPTDRHVIAIEPSAAMRRVRPSHCVPAIAGRAERLPLDDQSVDASMAIATVHQWQDLDAGLGELRRVTRGAIVVMAFDGDALDRFWLAHYAPELIEAQRRRDPSIATLCERLSGHGRRTSVIDVAIPHDCSDGFLEAYYARPERMLEPAVTHAQSGWLFVDAGVRERFAEKLRADLASGRWDAKFGEFRTMPTLAGSLRLLVSTAGGSA